MGTLAKVAIGVAVAKGVGGMIKGGAGGSGGQTRGNGGLFGGEHSPGASRSGGGLLLDNLGDISAQERAFVENEMRRPVDAGQLASQVPSGMEQQVYLMSVMGINLDNKKEAQYLHDLATALKIGKNEVNAVHGHLGVPKLYS